MIRRCAGSSAAKRPRDARRRRARWAASRRAGSQRKRTFRRSPICPANGSTRFMAAVRREASCSIWIRASARRMANRRMSVWNGHYECTCYHPLFVFNQFGDLERCALRPGNVHSADGWERVLKPVVARYRGKVSRIYFRADAGFANPDVYEYLEAERIKYAIRLPANRDLAGTDRLSAQAPGRAPSERGAALLCELHLSGGKLDEAAPGRRQGRVASGRTLSARRLHRHQHGAAARECRRLLQQARARASSGSKRARARSNGRGCHAARSPPTPFGFSFMRSPTISAISCARWRRPSRSRTGR